jgi:hypothetical protein
VDCFNNVEASPDAFENFLDPLQKLLRLSPPVASTLANPDLFLRTAQKLNTKKAVVRLNLLRIIRSICDASEDQGGASLVRKFGLYEAVERLAESDQAILVREMASDLIRSSDQSSRRGLENTVLRPSARRSSASTMTPSPQQISSSVPGTPQHFRSAQSKGYFDSTSNRLTENSRAARVPTTTALTPSTFRPTSRDSSSGDQTSSLASRVVTSASAAWSGSTGSTKSSRLPRTNTAPSSGTRLTRLSFANGRKEENITPTHTPGTAAGAGRTGSALNPGRRRRVTSSGTGTGSGSSYAPR